MCVFKRTHLFTQVTVILKQIIHNHCAISQTVSKGWLGNVFNKLPEINV